MGQHDLPLPGDAATFGKDLITLEISLYGKDLFTEEILYIFVIGIVKLSMLAFYWRLFRDSIRIPCYILGILILCWHIAVVGQSLDPALMLR